MKQTRRILAIILSVLMIFVFTACNNESTDSSSESNTVTEESKDNNETSTSESSSKSDESMESSKDILVMRMDADPGTFNLVNTYIMNAVQILSMTTCTLLRTVDDGKGGTINAIDDRYGLATEYAFDDDNMGMTFTIRDNAKWHDGNPVTADDVVYSLKRYTGNSRYGYVDYENITKVDDNTVHIGFTRTDSNALFGIGTMWIVEQSVLEEIGEEEYFTTTNYIGCGPYKVVSWVPGDSIDLEAVDDYFGGTPKIKNIRIRFIAEASVGMMELETGGIDVIDIPNWVDVQNIMNGEYEGIAKAVQISDMLHTCAGFNLSSDSPFQDLRVRQAFAYALDRDTIALGAYEGVGQVAYTIFSDGGENMLRYTPETWPYSLNVEKAKELLADAGYPDGFEMTLLTNQDANRSMAAQIAKNQLAEVGIEASIVNYDNATYAATMANETDSWDVWFRNWGAGTVWYSMIDNTIAVNCHPNESDETWIKYKTLSSDMAKEMDTEKRYAIENEIQENFLTEALYIYNLIAPVKNYVMVDNLYGLTRVSYYWDILDAYFE